MLTRVTVVLPAEAVLEAVVERHVVADLQRGHDRVLLEDHGRRVALVVGGRGAADRAARRDHQPRQQPQERGLAAAARPDDGEYLTAADLERDSADRLETVWVAEADVREGDDRAVQADGAASLLADS